MNALRRASEEERRQCRRRWLAARADWQDYGEVLRCALSPRVANTMMVYRRNAREEMRSAAAARVSRAARETRAEVNSSVERLVSLRARWLEAARTMDALADECADLCEDSDAAECRERARTIRECAADLEREWAGMKANAGDERTDSATRGIEAK